MTNELPSPINKQWKQRPRDANPPVQKITYGLQNQYTQTCYWPGQGFRFHTHLSLRHGTTADIHQAFQNYFSSTSTSSLKGVENSQRLESYLWGILHTLTELQRFFSPSPGYDWCHSETRTEPMKFRMTYCSHLDWKQSNNDFNDWLTCRLLSGVFSASLWGK